MIADLCQTSTHFKFNKQFYNVKVMTRAFEFLKVLAEVGYTKSFPGVFYVGRNYLLLKLNFHIHHRVDVSRRQGMLKSKRCSQSVIYSPFI